MLLSVYVMNPINYIKKIKQALLFPVGKDKAWDKECENSFGRALDIFYYLGITTLIIYGLLLLWVLVF